MSCHFRKNIFRSKANKAFTLVEVAASLIILTMIASSLLVILNRYVERAVDSDLKIRAFELARENMERLLGSDKVTDSVTYGMTEDDSGIEWENAVESFYEPLTQRMWIRAVCTANYIDAEGEEQEVELEHWLTDVSKKQLVQIMEQKKRQQEYEAALAEDDYFDENLPLDENGEPIDEYNPDERPDDSPAKEKEETICGYTMSQLNKMDINEIVKILFACDEF